MALITATKQVEQYGKALQMRSLDEYVVYKNAGLKPVMVNGKTALVQNIDLDFVSQLPDGTWFWTGDLAYCVKNYKVKLASDFITILEQIYIIN